MESRSVPGTKTARVSGIKVGDLSLLIGQERIKLLEAAGKEASLIEGICLYEHESQWAIPNHLALMIGMTNGTSAVVAAISEASTNGCAGVVLNCQVDPSVALILQRAAREHRVALYELGSGVPWLVLVDLLRHVLRDHGSADEKMSGGVALGDLVGLSEALADLLGGPIIIEDTSFRVLAYSSATGTVDHGRDAAILSKRIPTEWLKHLEDVGALETLLTSDKVIDVADGPYEARRRLLCAIRVDYNPLGILWLAEGAQPLHGDITEKMIVAARIAAPHLLRHQDENMGHRAGQLKVLRRLIDTGLLSRATAEEIGLLPAEGYVMVALRCSDDAALSHSERNRVVASIDLYCQSYRWRSATTAIGHTIYCLLVLNREQDPAQVYRLATGLATNAGRALLGRKVLTAVSQLGPELATVPRLRDQVEEVLEVLNRSACLDRRVLQYKDAVPQILLNEVRDKLMTRAGGEFHKLDELRVHDEANGTGYLDTLRVYLQTFGNVKNAAVRLGLHPTTLRYRLRRITEISGLDFENDDERLLCQLLLREY